MFTVSTGPVLVLVALGLLSPSRYGSYLLGASLCLADTAVIAGPMPVSAPWLGLLALLARDVHPDPGRLARRCLSLPAGLLLVLLVYDLFAIALAGTVFNDRFRTMPNTAFFKQDLAQTVAVVPAHFNQFIYLVLGVAAALMISAAFEGRRQARAEALLERVLIGFVLAGSGVALWQWASFSGLAFPTAFFHSGARTLAYDQMIGGVRRVSGPFSEPSALGNQLGPAVGFLAALPAFGRGAALRWPAVLVGALALVLSTSTTAFAVLPLILLLLVAGFALRLVLAGRCPDEAEAARLTLDGAVVVAAVAGAMVLAAVLALQPHTRDILYQTLINKNRTSSFEERGAADRLAIELMVQTLGLGIGLGGHVASNAWLTVGAGLGLFGVAVFAAALGGALVPTCLLTRRRPTPQQPSAAFQIALAALVLSALFTNAISGANINQPVLWMIVGFALRRFEPGSRPPVLRPAIARRLGPAVVGPLTAQDRPDGGDGVEAPSPGLTPAPEWRTAAR